LDDDVVYQQKWADEAGKHQEQAENLLFSSGRQGQQATRAGCAAVTMTTTTINYDLLKQQSTTNRGRRRR
jgi:hypothetical protein